MTTDAITLADVLDRLTENDIGHELVHCGEDAVVVVSQAGGRLYGPFFAGGPSATWLPEAFAEPQEFAALLRSGRWNLGGQRYWIGPELQYIVTDRQDYWGTFDVPPRMDPGVYSLSRVDEVVSLEASGEFTAYNLATGTNQLQWRKQIRALPHPLRHVAGVEQETADVRFAGYVVELTLTQPEPGLMAESWDLVQVHTPGTVMIPATPAAQVTDYYEPAGPLVQSCAGGVRVTLTGCDKFKIGVKAPHTFGRMALHQPLDDSSSRLIVRQVSVDPSSDYPEEPDFAPGESGDALHVYSDEGPLGGFGEMEARGRSIGSGHGRASVSDDILTWVFEGPNDQIDYLVQHLLGDFSEAPQ